MMYRQNNRQNRRENYRQNYLHLNIDQEKSFIYKLIKDIWCQHFELKLVEYPGLLRAKGTGSL